MKLPNSENALVPKDKLENYLLSEIHPIGRFKAVFFKNLGYDDGDTDVLANDLSSIAQQEDFQTPSGATVAMRTVWIIEQDNPQPRLITAYPT